MTDKPSGTGENEEAGGQSRKKAIAAAVKTAKPRKPAGGAVIAADFKGKDNARAYFCQQFALHDTGLWWEKPAGDGESMPVHVSGRLEVIATTRDTEGQSFGKLLRWEDETGNTHEWAMPAALLAGDGNELRKFLLDGGLYLSPTRYAREGLMTFLGSAPAAAFATCVSRLGWHAIGTAAVFVLPDHVFGEAAGERVILQGADLPPHAFAVAGDLDGWRRRVAVPCAGNSRLVLAVSTAFAAALLRLADEPNGAIHFRGNSRSGKTTALRVAGSVWGGGGINGFLRTWRSTANGVEAVAAMHCDALVCMDELDQVDGREAGEAAYMLANGQGKARAARAGELRKVAAWRSLVLSTGEVSLADKMAEASRTVRAGQEVRLVDLPADAGAGFGLFEALHGADSPRAFADALNEAARQCHGIAIRVFLDRLTSHLNGAEAHGRFVDDLRAQRAAFVKRVAPSWSDGQVLSVAGRFGLIAAAGELASDWEVTGWPRGEATRALERCFKDWLEARGTAGAREAMAAVAAVRAFVSLHGESRFQTVKDADEEDGDGRQSELQPVGGRPIINRAGWRRWVNDEIGQGVWEYLILPDVWAQEVCRGLDPRAVAKELASRGLLATEKGSDGVRYQVRERLPTAGRIRVYRVLPDILAASAAADEAAD